MPGEARDARVGCAYVNIGLSFDRARYRDYMVDPRTVGSPARAWLRRGRRTCRINTVCPAGPHPRHPHPPSPGRGAPAAGPVTGDLREVAAAVHRAPTAAAGLRVVQEKQGTVRVLALLDPLQERAPHQEYGVPGHCRQGRAGRTARRPADRTKLGREIGLRGDRVDPLHVGRVGFPAGHRRAHQAVQGLAQEAGVRQIAGGDPYRTLVGGQLRLGEPARESRGVGESLQRRGVPFAEGGREVQTGAAADERERECRVGGGGAAGHASSVHRFIWCRIGAPTRLTPVDVVSDGDTTSTGVSRPGGRAESRCGMRAVRIDRFGGPEGLVPVDVPDPVPGPGEVLMRIAAAGVNRADALLRAGLYHRAGHPPLIPGAEAAGIVVEVGEGVTGFAPGQRVMALDGGKSSGFYAELATVPASQVVGLPDGVDLARAAALPIAWLSAWYCVRHLARVSKDDTVVVKAAASGVGTAAVQIAAETGARVLALAGSADKAAWAGEFGADVTVDTSAFSDDAEVEEVLRLTDGRGADVVLDTVGGRAFGRSLREVGLGGRVVALANVALEPSTVDTRDFYPKNASILGFQLTNLQIHGYDARPDLRELADRVAAGGYRVPIETVVPLEEARAAHERLERRDNRGKIVLSAGPGFGK